MAMELRPSDCTARLMVTVVLCESGISQQGSANSGYLHLSLPPSPTPVFFFFFSSQYLIVGTREWKKHTANSREVFIHSPGKEESMPGPWPD